MTRFNARVFLLNFDSDRLAKRRARARFNTPELRRRFENLRKSETFDSFVVFVTSTFGDMV